MTLRPTALTTVSKPGGTISLSLFLEKGCICWGNWFVGRGHHEWKANCGVAQTFVDLENLAFVIEVADEDFDALFFERLDLRSLVLHGGCGCVDADALEGRLRIHQRVGDIAPNDASRTNDEHVLSRRGHVCCED